MSSDELIDISDASGGIPFSYKIIEVGDWWKVSGTGGASALELATGIFHKYTTFTDATNSPRPYQVLINPDNNPMSVAARALWAVQGYKLFCYAQIWSEALEQYELFSDDDDNPIVFPYRKLSIGVHRIFLRVGIPGS